MASVRDAADRVQAAIDFGRLAAQRAPSGDPIFDSLTAAEAELREIKDQIPWWSVTGEDPAPYFVDQGAAMAIDRIYDDAANIRNDPSAPLAKTTYEAPSRVPWAWIGAGVVAAVGASIVLYRQARARR